MRLSRRVSVIEGGLMRRFIFILLLLAMGICAFYMLEQINMTSYALAVSRLSSSYFIEVYRNGDSRSLNEAKYIIDEVGSIKSGFDGFLLFGKTTLVDDSVLDSFNRIQECKRIELNYTADNMLKLDQKECCVISNAVDILSNRISAMVDAKDGVSIVSIKHGKFINGKWFDSSVGRSFQISYIYNAVINKLCKSQSGMVKRDCVYVNVEANNK